MSCEISQGACKVAWTFTNIYIKKIVISIRDPLQSYIAFGLGAMPHEGRRLMGREFLCFKQAPKPTNELKPMETT